MTSCVRAERCAAEPSRRAAGLGDGRGLRVKPGVALVGEARRVLGDCCRGRGLAFEQLLHVGVSAGGLIAGERFDVLDGNGQP